MNKKPDINIYTRYRTNSDREKRQHERQSVGGDIQAESSHLAWRRRQGLLDHRLVELAAYLGHPASLEIVDPSVLDSLPNDVRSSYDVRSSFTHSRQEIVLAHLQSIWYNNLHSRFGNLAVEFAEHTIHIWKNQYPQDNRPELAIKAVQKWDANSEKVLSHSFNAAVDAATQAEMAAFDASMIWRERDDELTGWFPIREYGPPASKPPEYLAIVNARNAAAAATWAGRSVHAASATFLTVRDTSVTSAIIRSAKYAVNAASFEIGASAEEEWQRQHLISVLLRD